MLLNSDAINEIAAALAKAQSEMKPPEKDKKANYGSYATLGSILSSCKPALNKHGLSISQQLDSSKELPCIVTTLYHTSGQFLRSCIPLPQRIDPKKNALQSLGETLTYLKRYSISALLCIDADEDSDGSVQENVTPAIPQKKVPPAPKESLSLDDVEYLKSILHPDDLIKAIDFCKKQFKTDDLRFMARETYDKWVMRAKEKLAEEVGDEG